MKKINKLKLFSTLSVIPILLLLGLFLSTPENVDIIKTVFSHDLTNAEIREHLSGFGIRGLITVSILSMLQLIIAVLPAEPVQVVAGLAYGFWTGLAACLVGVILGNTVIYLLYKIYGDKMRAYFDSKLDIDLHSAKATSAVAAVIFILYFLPAIPYGMICFLGATLGLRYDKYLLINTLGAIPSICIGVGLGHIALSTSWIVSVAVFAVLLVLLSVVMIKRDYFIGKVNDFLKKSSVPYSSKTTVRKYSSKKLSVAYVIFRILMLGRLKFRMNKKVKKLEKPSIVLCNHGAFMDFCFAGSLTRETSPNFIVNRMYFYKKSLGNLLRSFGCFPKSMFDIDTESAMNCVRVVRGGGVLAMMPEARLSTVGKFEDIQESTHSFLKKMGVPVYIIKIRGDYLATPKWGKGMRRGSLVEAELDLLFTPEELSTLEIADIRERVEREMRYDEFEWLATHPEVNYRSRRMAEGLENMLTVCPECGARYSIETHGRQLFCTKCSLKTELDGRYEFTGGVRFKNFAEWYEWQSELIQQQIRENGDYSLSSPVTLKHASKDGKTMLVEAGEGVCTLNRRGLTYIGSEYGESVEKNFPLDRIYRLLFGAGEDFEIYEGKEIWYFTPTERKSCVDWYIASGVLNQSFTEP